MTAKQKKVMRDAYELWEAWRLIADKKRAEVAPLAYVSVAKTSESSVASRLTEEQARELAVLA
jgi:hypothetical protein